MSYLLIHGDARKLPVDPRSIDAIVSDPPYGIGYVLGKQGKNKGKHTQTNHGIPIHGDSIPFDPSPWIEWPCVLWGADHFKARLPNRGTMLAWDKSDGMEFTDTFVDCEFAWSSANVKRNVCRYLWKGVCVSQKPQTDGVVRRVHPTQKPVTLMRWSIRHLRLEPNSLILDPYCGSGPVGIAALQEGHRFIGIDIERKYVEIARRRLERPHQVVGRPGKPEHHPLFPEGP